MTTQLLDGSERLGVVGSPSTTLELVTDVLGGAVQRKLVGELAALEFQQDGISHVALGQITEVELRNPWHEDPTMRSLIRQRGRVDAVSERQDIHIGKMTLSAVFGKRAQGQYDAAFMGTVPSTGTFIHLVDDTILRQLLARFQQQLFYMGHVYGSRPMLPTWFKHFGSGQDGAGEAYHIGVFGKSGSGKSHLTKMILTAYARHPDLSLLVIDPQGEFAKLASAQGSDSWKFGDTLRGLGRRITAINVKRLVLDTWSLFIEIALEGRIFQTISGPTGEVASNALEYLKQKLTSKGVKLSEISSHASFDTFWSLLKDAEVQKIIYRSADSRTRFSDAVGAANPDEFFTNVWQPITALFDRNRQGSKAISDALKYVIEKKADKPIVIIDLSLKDEGGALLWNDRIQALVIKRLLDELKRIAESHYKDDKSLNMLVVLDEAHRLAPRETPDIDAASAVRSSLIDAVRTTRKYGLGWLFVSQTLSSLHQEILGQLRMYFVGFGLALGQEFQSLRQIAGSSEAALGLYQSFRDPQSALDAASRQYSFMTVGPASPLSFAGTPLFLNVFSTPEAFWTANSLRHSGS